MAKNTITEEDLLAGVGGFGSFNTLGSGKPVRDNPFRDTRREAPAAQPVAEKKAAPAAVSVLPTPLAAQIKVETVPSAVSPVSKVVEPQVTRQRVELAPKETFPAENASAKKTKHKKKADLYGEKISTFLSSDMRDELTSTARLLNSNRLVKGDPITLHTLMRCGVRVITELLDLSKNDVISSEEELYALIKRKLVE